MKIVYVAMKYDYGDPARGLSFEHTNFYETLINMGHNIIYFDFMSIFKEKGKEQMNQQLLDLVQKEKPNLVFFCLFTDEFKKETIRQIGQIAPTFNWFCDDHWRFDNYSKFWAPYFTYISTTATSAIPKYKKIGYKNVIKTQWACNHFTYKKMNLPSKHDVTFIGQSYGNRKKIIDTLRSADINVETWGYGWENGRVSQEEMIKIFNQSKININLSNSYQPWWKNIIYGQEHQQIKGRNFEIPGCGGFTLSGQADNLGDYYKTEEEIVTYKNIRNLIKKVKYYLLHNKERECIAQAGYERTINEHTYEKRFNEIFKTMKLK